MSDVQATKDDLRRLAGAGDHSGAPKLSRSRNWNWYDPPVVIPISLLLLIVGYGLVKATV